MKNILSIAVILFINFSLYAQTANVLIRTEGSDRFTVMLNEAKQNPNPETQVKIIDLNAEFYKMKILFEDTDLTSIDKILYLAYGTERTYSIRKNKKGKYIIRMVSETPFEELSPPVPGQIVIIYNSKPGPTGVAVTETAPATLNGINDSISKGSRVSTTLSSADSTGGLLPNCITPITQDEFTGLKSAISSQPFENNKLQIAKKSVNSNCLLSSQVKEIMMLFDFENSKLDLAKYAYDYTFDKSNYYMVNTAFANEISIDALNQHIKSKK